jgi:pyruvate/2-oxoglutarate dehydrogenase complex dihydrolipoamide acyltransferase (E2) component
MSGSSATPTPPLSLAEMQVLVSRAGLTLNPGQMADLVLAWRQVVALVASIPRDRPLLDDQAFVFRLPPPPSASPAGPGVSTSARPPATRPPTTRPSPKLAAAKPVAAKPAPRPNAGKPAKPTAAKAKPAKSEAAVAVNRAARPATKKAAAQQPTGKSRAANKPAAKPAARTPRHPTRTKVRSLSTGGPSARPRGRR